MTERWQRELSRLKQAQLPSDLWERVTEGPRLEPLAPPRRSRVATAATALAMFTGTLILVWAAFRPFLPQVDTLAGPAVIRVPPRDQVAPVFLRDGRPVFVIHHRDGSLSVVDFLSSHRAWGIGDPVVWCPSTREFVEVAHEAHFDEDGIAVAGPAPGGLVTFAFEVVSRDDSGDPSAIRVGAMQEADPRRSPTVGDPSRPPFCPPGGAVFNEIEPVSVLTGYTGSRAMVVAHTIDDEAIWDSPADAASAEPEGWIAVHGTLHIARDGFIQLCREVIGRPKEPVDFEAGRIQLGRCEDGAIVRGIDGFRLLTEVFPSPGVSAYEKPQVWLARVRDGVIDDLTGFGFAGPGIVRP